MPEKKYEFVEGDEIEFEGCTLRRIRALKKLLLSDGRTIYPNTLGGYIEHEGNLTSTGNCWVGERAKVYGRALVSDDAFVGGGR